MTWLQRADPAIAGPTGDPNSMSWLQRLLSQEFLGCAIYSADYKYQDIPAPLVDAAYLYADVKAHLRSTPFDERAPIVFVAHGLDSVVVKRVRISRYHTSKTNISAGHTTPLWRWKFEKLYPST